MSFRNDEDLLVERGILASYGTVRRWVTILEALSCHAGEPLVGIQPIHSQQPKRSTGFNVEDRALLDEIEAREAGTKRNNLNILTYTPSH